MSRALFTYKQCLALISPFLQLPAFVFPELCFKKEKPTPSVPFSPLSLQPTPASPWSLSERIWYLVSVGLCFDLSSVWGCPSAPSLWESFLPSFVTSPFPCRFPTTSSLLFLWCSPHPPPHCRSLSCWDTQAFFVLLPFHILMGLPIMDPPINSQGFSYCLGGESLPICSFQDLNCHLQLTCPCTCISAQPAHSHPTRSSRSPSILELTIPPSWPNSLLILDFCFSLSSCLEGRILFSLPPQWVLASPHMLRLPGSAPGLFSRLLWWLVNSSPVSSLTPPTHCHTVPEVTLWEHGATHAIPFFPDRHQYNPDSSHVRSKPFIAQMSASHFSSLTSNSIFLGLGPSP